MPDPDTSTDRLPLLQPRLVRAMKNRPRLVDRGFRREVLSELEEAIIERRTTDTVAARVANLFAGAGRDLTERVARKEAKRSLDRANYGPLRRL